MKRVKTDDQPPPAQAKADVVVSTEPPSVASSLFSANIDSSTPSITPLRSQLIQESNTQSLPPLTQQPLNGNVQVEASSEAVASVPGSETQTEASVTFSVLTSLVDGSVVPGSDDSIGPNRVPFGTAAVLPSSATSTVPPSFPLESSAPTLPAGIHSLTQKVLGHLVDTTGIDSEQSEARRTNGAQQNGEQRVCDGMLTVDTDRHVDGIDNVAALNRIDFGLKITETQST